MYNDGRPTSEASINDLPLSNSPHSGDMKRMSMRIAQITAVHIDDNTVDLKWLWPARGGISGVNLSKPYVGLRSGIHFMPEVGSIVVLGYAFNIPVILSYVLPTDYKKMLSGDKDSNGKATRLQKINPGEILLNSVQNAEIYIHDQIQLLDNAGDVILIDPGTGTILNDSLNWKITNEAGSIFMGMVKRVVAGKQTIITSDGKPISSSTGGNALTEYKIDIKEFSDNTINDTSANPSIATITVGTLVDANGKKVLNEVGSQIVCDIKFASGARIQVDKSGAINLNEGRMTTPTQIVAPNSDPLSSQSSPNFKPTIVQQGAARNGDLISIPIGSSTDKDHPELQQMAVLNTAEIAAKIAPYFLTLGAFPCIYIPSPIPVNLQGQIVTGSKDVFIGSSDEKINS
jgi:hypothetical protein